VHKGPCLWYHVPYTHSICKTHHAYWLESYGGCCTAGGLCSVLSQICTIELYGSCTGTVELACLGALDAGSWHVGWQLYNSKLMSLRITAYCTWRYLLLGFMEVQLTSSTLVLAASWLVAVSCAPLPQELQVQLITGRRGRGSDGQPC